MGIVYDTIYPTDDEIDAVLNECADNIDAGRQKYPGESYEDGVKATIEWLLSSPTELDTYSPME